MKSRKNGMKPKSKSKVIKPTGLIQIYIFISTEISSEYFYFHIVI